MTRNHFCSGERCDPTPVNTAYGPARARPRLARRLARVRPSPGLVARPGAPLLLRVTCSPASGAGDTAGLGRPSRALPPPRPWPRPPRARGDNATPGRGRFSLTELETKPSCSEPNRSGVRLSFPLSFTFGRLSSAGKKEDFSLPRRTLA